MNRADSKEKLIRILNSYAYDRNMSVETGEESPEMAAYSMSVYGYAIADAAKELFGSVISADIYTETCYLASEFDSHLQHEISEQERIF